MTEPVITAWKARHRSVSGHQGAYTMREIANAILYQSRTGCQRAYLLHDLPPKSATYYYFAAWRDDGTDQVIHELLRCQVRERARRLENPTLVVLDTQSVHAAAGIPATTTGRDAGKRVPGGKRCRAMDVLGLVIAVTVLAASASACCVPSGTRCCCPVCTGATRSAPPLSSRRPPPRSPSRRSTAPSP